MNASRFHGFLAVQSIQSKLSYTHYKINHLLQNNNYIIACKRTLFQRTQIQIRRQNHQHKSYTWTRTNHATTTTAAGMQRTATFQQLKSYRWTAAILSSVTASALLFYDPYRSAIVDNSIGIQSTQQPQQQQQQQQRNLIAWTSSCLSSFLHRWAHYILELHYRQHDPMNRTLCDSGNQTATTTSSIAPQNPTSTVHYSEDPDYYDTNDTSGYIEEERFYQCVTYHRSLLHDYNRRWGNQNNSRTSHSRETKTASPQQQQQQRRRWPRNVPEHADEVSALEFDLRFCESSLRYRQNQNMTTTITSIDGSNNGISSAIRSCQDTSFRIATYYIFTLQPSTTAKNIDNASQIDIHSYKQIQHDKGFRVIKELAEQGYPDAMCLYGILLNEGTHGVEANPQQAVVWWRRCVDEYGHVNSMYELATACYLGEGIVENAPMAVSLFRRAAHLGHPGAAYMLGECQLNGVGVERDRTDALEWLVTAAELGHRGAQDRVLMILNEDYGTTSSKESSDDAKQRQLEETVKWINDEDVPSYDPSIETLHKAVNIERRFTIGGGSRNPVVVARRKTIVAESREEH